MDVVVTYDIRTTTSAGERRLARVARVCESYGVRVQYSVFECRLSSARLQRLMFNLADEIDPRVDSINIYRFDGALTEMRTSLGRRTWREPGDAWIV